MPFIKIELKTKVLEALQIIKPPELTVEEFLQQVITSFTIQRILRLAMEEARRKKLREISKW